MKKEIKIQVPEGYEIDKEKSTFENIIFKKKNTINCWEDLKEISGYGITTENDIVHWSKLSVIKDNKNVFHDVKYAESALALAQISQLLPYYDSNVNWDNESECKFCIYRENSYITIDTYYGDYKLLAFKSKEEAERFLKYNEQLVKAYFML